MLKDGYFRVGRLGGVAHRLHWSVPVGALVFGSLRIEPWAWLAFWVVITLHVLGHALMVKGMGLRLAVVELAGFGGQCGWRGSADVLQRAWIAWGGIMAQLLLLAATLAVRLIGTAPESHAGQLLEHGFIQVNLWIIGLNLLPIAPLDGAAAWRLFSELRARRWTLRRAVLHALARWAERRRRSRSGDAEGLELEPNGAEPIGVTQNADDRLRDGDPARRRSDASAEEDELDLHSPAPSPEAQRELAALFERVANEAAKAKRRR